MQPFGEKRLVSVIVWVYNLAPYVRQAINSALSQTYAPLEVVLSDDHSSDGTWEILEEMARGYVGPHRVVLNRNEKNLGLIGHLNRARELARGELIVMLSGDDVFLPGRIEQIVDAWDSGGRRKQLITSMMSPIDESGESLGRTVSGGPPFCGDDRSLRLAVKQTREVLGASFAWHHSVFDEFGPVCTRRTFEDAIMYFRACLLDGVVRCEEPRMLYRIHQEQTSRGKARTAEDLRRQIVSGARSSRRVCSQMRRDLARAMRLGYITEAECHAALRMINTYRRSCAVSYLSEKPALAPSPPLRAMLLAMTPPTTLRSVALVAAKRVAPWFWRWKRARHLSTLAGEPE